MIRKTDKIQERRYTTLYNEQCDDLTHDLQLSFPDGCRYPLLRRIVKIAADRIIRRRHRHARVFLRKRQHRAAPCRDPGKIGIAVVPEPGQRVSVRVYVSVTANASKAAVYTRE